METYTLLRQFADSWMLLALMLFFLGVVVWVFRPGARARQDQAASVIFRNENRPASVPLPSDKDRATDRRTPKEPPQ